MIEASRAAFARRTGIDYPPLPTPDLASSNQPPRRFVSPAGNDETRRGGSALVEANGIFFLGHVPRHEAANSAHRPVHVIRPNHCRTSAVRAVNHGAIGNVYPFTF